MRQQRQHPATFLARQCAVEPDLTPEMAQGLFARPGEHRGYVRLPTNASDVLPDAVSSPRGLAPKLLDPAVEQLSGTECTTQNFIVVDGKVFHVATAEKFLDGLET